MDEIALRGGPQACPPGTLPPWPMYDEQEARALQSVLQSRKWWRMAGGEVDAFEREFASFLDCEHALAVTTGSHALEIALAALGIGFGDEVIVPAFTFAATGTAVLCVGAVPVVVDVDARTYCMDPAAVAAAITPRTRALVPVHMAGHSCDMTQLRELCERHGLQLISDAAHAPGARWGGQSVARLSDVSIYSFQAFKLMTAGEGGAVVMNDPQVRERAWLRHSCGRPHGDRRYQHLELGTNARLNEFQGALLRAQLARLPAQMAEREAASRRLNELLVGLPGLLPMGRAPQATTHCHYMYLVEVREEELGLTRDELVEVLSAEGVPAYRAYPPLPELAFLAQGKLWGGRPLAELSPELVREAVNRHPIPVARRIGSQALWLHHTVLLGGARVQEAVGRAFQKAVEHGRRRAR
jgi:3-amino-5-hydroxybenzoate synthase